MKGNVMKNGEKVTLTFKTATPCMLAEAEHAERLFRPSSNYWLEAVKATNGEEPTTDWSVEYSWYDDDTTAMML